MGENYIGLMSGTSIDGADGVLVEFDGERMQVLAHAYRAFDPAQRAELLALNTDRKSTRLNSSHRYISRMPSSA
jgi:anhydro-N-acetylmuramic acid kinase